MNPAEHHFQHVWVQYIKTTEERINIYNKLESNPGPFAPQEISLTTKPFKEATATLLVSHQVAHGPDDDHGDVHRDHDLHPRRRNSRLKREQKLSVSHD